MLRQCPPQGATRAGAQPPSEGRMGAVQRSGGGCRELKGECAVPLALKGPTVSGTALSGNSVRELLLNTAIQPPEKSPSKLKNGEVLVKAPSIV